MLFVFFNITPIPAKTARSGRIKSTILIYNQLFFLIFPTFLPILKYSGIQGNSQEIS